MGLQGAELPGRDNVFALLLELLLGCAGDRPIVGHGDSDFPACFPAGTRIATPTGEIDIERISPGQAVLGFGPEDMEVALVRHVTTHEPSALVAIDFGDTGRLVTTPGHPVFDPDGRVWRPASAFRPGDLVRTVEGTETVTSFQYLPHREPVFDLAVRDTENYFANGVLVHNKSVLDVDGDGSPADEDCDDDDAYRYPGAVEDCADGIDNDCDDLVDAEDEADCD